MNTCPVLERWEVFAHGDCSEDEARALAEHSASCQECARTLESVRLNLGVASAVRSALQKESSPRFSTPLGMVGRKFDGFTIVRVLGSGASSTVYEARQERTGRSVAIKLLSTFAMSPEHLRRFEHEAKILAKLRHPGIAQIYGCGTVTDDAGARPYIAMELVDGVPISRHVATLQLPRDARIALLAQACEAVEYAHSCGIVHRDLKPANLLVTKDGSLRVVDFGVARLTGAQSMLSTMHTAQGQIVGTVAYMSPEHVLGAHAVEARSDVYSLGVIGYELLTGKSPYEITDTSLEAALRTITQTEPLLPSRMNASLRGDIETILLRSLGKRPQDRYPSAGDLAADLRRVIAGEPILARRPTLTQRIGKFGRQNRALVAGAGSVFIALCIGLAGTTYGMVRATERTRLAEERRKNAEQLASLLEQMLREAHPHEAKGRGYTVRQMLDEFDRKFSGGLSDQPLVEASLRTTMGTGYRVLGEYAKARPHLERALQLGQAIVPHSAVAEGKALCELARLEHDEGAYDKAIAGFSRAAALFKSDPALKARAVMGWSDCLRHSGDMAQALEKGKTALELAKMPAISQQVAGAVPSNDSSELHIAEATINLSRIERDAGNFDAAQAGLDSAMQLFTRTLGADDPRQADALNDKAWLAFMRRENAAAEATARDALKLGERTLGPTHPDLGNSKYELGLILSTRGKNDEGEAMLRDAAAIYTVAHGAVHPSTFTAKEALARVLRISGKLEEAHVLLDEVLTGRRAFFGNRNIEVAYGLSALGQLQRDLKEYAAAQATLHEAIEIYRETYHSPHRYTAYALGYLAGIAQDQGDLAQAEHLAQESASTMEQALGPAHADTLSAVASLAQILEARNEFQRAIGQFDQILKRATPATPSVRVALAHQGRGRCLLALGDVPAAVKEHTIALAAIEAADASTPAAAQRLKKVREDLAKAQEALVNAK